MVCSKKPAQSVRKRPAAEQEPAVVASSQLSGATSLSSSNSSTSSSTSSSSSVPPAQPTKRRKTGKQPRSEAKAPPRVPVFSLDKMENSGGGNGGSDSSAGASGSPPEESHHFAPSSMMLRGSGSRAAELSGALGSFLKRTSQLDDGPGGGGMSRFSSMFRDLKSDDGNRQIMALTELSEYLSFSSEEALISFPMETFIPVLIGLLEDPGPGDETAAQVMVLCCRCLFNVVDILPPTTRIITSAGGLPVLCANLLNVAYIDVAELAVAIIERISEDQPVQVLKAGGLTAILTFLDFFQIAVQRQAVNAAALMLMPIPPSDVFEQHVRSAMPTLAQLLQHSDPQVLQSVCECWRRLLDNTIIIHTWPKSVAKGKWRGGGKKDRGDDDFAGASSAAAAAVEAATAGGSAASSAVVSTVLEDICPSGVLSNFLVLLNNGLASPSPHTSVVAGEALYILSVLTNYSDVFANDVLKQDICNILRQMVLTMDLGHSGSASSQNNFGLLRVLAAVASLMPTMQLRDAACICDEKRLSLFKANPEYLDALGDTFLPAVVDAYEASIDPSLQSLSVTLLLTVFLACRDRPDAIRRSLEPTRVARLLANMLLARASRSVMFACLLIVYELLERHPQPYSLLFVRHGVVHAIHQLVTRGDAQKKSSRSLTLSGKAVGAAIEKANAQSRAKLVEQAAHRVLSSYFASSQHTGESPILRALAKIARQLRSSPTAVIAAHREALEKLQELLHSNEGITAFEFTCSGTAGALNAFLYPPTANKGDAASNDGYTDRLRLFLDVIAKSKNGTFPKLVRLCVSAVQRAERLPLSLFPTGAALSTALPPHLRPHFQPPPQMHTGGKGGGPGEGGSSSSSGRGGSIFGGGDLGSAFSSRRSNDPGGNAGHSASLSVLRLLGKAVRVRMSPHGASGQTSPSSSSLSNLRTLFMPQGGKGAPGRFHEQRFGPPGSASGSDFAAAAAQAAASSASPAARLRNYFASKVSRKRATPMMGGSSSAAGASSAGAASADKKPVGVAGLLLATTKGKASAAAAAAAAMASSAAPWGQSQAGDSDAKGPLGALDPWHSMPPWDDDDESGGGPENADEMAERLREHMSEIVEAVLLVEPLAMVSALEEYIWEKHSLRSCFESGPFSQTQSSAATSTSAGPSTSSPPASAAAGPAAATPGVSSGSRDSRASPAGKKPPPLDTALSPATPDQRQEASSPRTPMAIIDPMTPSVATSEDPRRDLTGQDDGSNIGEPLARAVSGKGAGKSLRDKDRDKKRVVIYLNGQQLKSKMSVVQALVAHASRAVPRTRSKDDGSRSRIRTDRFLVSTEEDSHSEEDATENTGGKATPGDSIPSKQFYGTIWGRVHTMTYEIIDEPAQASASGSANGSKAASAAKCSSEDVSNPVVPSDFDCLVQRHAGVIAKIATLKPQATSGTSAASSSDATATPASTSDFIGSVEAKDAASAESAPKSSGSQANVDVPEDVEAEDEFECLLRLACAFHNMSSFLRSSQGLVGLEGLPSDEDFQCNSLTSKLLRQLSDPLAICTGSIPPWCARLSGVCRFLFPHNARRVLHHSCSLGLSRALHHIQQRTLAQSAHTAEQQRRLEGEVSIANIPRQKVRISRQRILESAIKVMNHYGSGSTILEVEYVGEVGTGSGPTLEFYAQVAEILRSSEPRLFRKSTPGGRLFPEPMAAAPVPSTASGGGEPPAGSTGPAGQRQQILERFRLLGQTVAKCILDNRLVDLQLHPLFWRAVLNTGPFSHRDLQDVDPELCSNMNGLRNMEDDALAALCVDFTLPGHPAIELKPGGAAISLSKANVDEYIALVTQATLVSGVSAQVAAFRTAFSELLPLQTCSIWSESELASIIVGASVRDDAVWTMDHLSAHIKAQHGYTADSQNFRDLLRTMAEFNTDDRRKFLTFVTGAPSLPLGGFAGLKPPLTVVKKEAPPAPLTPDQFMPSVMTCANYLKLPEYSSIDILKQKLKLAMSEGQSAFLLS